MMGGLTVGEQRGRVWSNNNQSNAIEMKLESHIGTANVRAGEVVLVDNTN